MPAGKLMIASTSTRTPTYKKGKGYATKDYVKKLIKKDEEVKQTWLFPITYFSSVANTWVQVPISQCQSGAREYERNGNKITLRSIEIKGVMAGGQSELLTDDAYNVMRLVICTARTNSPMTDAITPRSIDTPIRNFNCENLVKKYVDKYVTFNVAAAERGGGDGYAPSLRTFKFYKRWKNGLTLEYDGAGANDFKTSSPRLMMCMISDSAAPPNPGFIRGYIAMSYTDD